LGDKAELILKLHNRPMTQEEISTEILEERNPRTLGNRLISDPRFCRTDPDHFALKAWGLRQYSSIVGELVSEIARNGGEATSDYLTSTLISKFGVSEASVRSYLQSPRFVRTSRGTIRVRGHHEPFTVSKPIALTRRCYRLSHGWAYRITVDQDLLRGSGRPLPAAFAVEIGLRPLRTLELQSRSGSIPVAWRAAQPTVGSLRRVAEELGARVGDYLFMEILPKRTLGFLLLKSETITSVTGFDRLQIETGHRPDSDNAVALAQIAYALGLSEPDVSVAAISRRLRARGEDDLWSLLPQSDGGDSELALQELLGLVGG